MLVRTVSRVYIKGAVQRNVLSYSYMEILQSKQINRNPSLDKTAATREGKKGKEKST
jgi:hypothetical protein